MEKGEVHPIIKNDLEQHLKKADEKLTFVDRGDGRGANLLKLIQTIEGGTEVMMAKDVQETLGVLRQGECLYYEMYAVLDDRIRNQKIDGNINPKEKNNFLASYAMFAASSYVCHKLNKQFKEEETPEMKLQDFMFSSTKDTVLNYVLARLYGIVDVAKDKKDDKQLQTGKQLAQLCKGFFRKIREDARETREKIPKELSDLVVGKQFRIADEFDLTGYEISEFEETEKASKMEFAKVSPGEIVANVQAKRKVIRYMDRLALYDPAARNNPCVILGGLSFTNLWDGIPGTGKTTMIRMAMTRIAELCEIIGMKYKIHAIDQSVKSEFYGKTGQNAIAEFQSTRDPNFLHFTLMDDLDLLTTGSRQDTSGGADNDLRNVIMQFLDGAFTLRIGNNQVYAASNDPKGLDGAIRNRFNDRILVEGPKTIEDLSDMAFILSKELREAKLFNVQVGYEPFKTQDNYVNGKWTQPSEVVYAIDPEFAKRFRKATIKDFGQYLFELKQKNPSISGRSVKAIMEAVKEGSADFDVPPEFFTDPKVYREQPFEKKIEVLKKLYIPVQPEMLFQEAKRYAESEARYIQGEQDREVERGYNGRIWSMMAEMQAMEKHPEFYAQVEVMRRAIVTNQELLDGILERVKAGAKTGGQAA